MQREILRGRYRHYLTPEQRKAQANPGLRLTQAHQSIAEDQLWLQRMLTLAGADEKAPETRPRKHSLSNHGDEAWIRNMLALAADAGQDEQKKEKTLEQLDADLINDFINHRGDFAL